MNKYGISTGYDSIMGYESNWSMALLTILIASHWKWSCKANSFATFGCNEHGIFQTRNFGSSKAVEMTSLILQTSCIVSAIISNRSFATDHRHLLFLGWWRWALQDWRRHLRRWWYWLAMSRSWCHCLICAARLKGWHCWLSGAWRQLWWRRHWGPCPWCRSSQ